MNLSEEPSARARYKYKVGEAMGARFGGGQGRSVERGSGERTRLFSERRGDGGRDQGGPAFQKLGENALGARTLASCAVVEGALFIRTEEHLYKINGG
jgi:hypothetical protein